MTLDHRCIEILTKIIQTPRYVQTSEIMEGLNISKRTVYYDVEKINDWLKDNHFEPLSYVRSAGFYVSDEARIQIKQTVNQLEHQQIYEYSPQEREAWAVILILTREKRILLQTFLDRFHVSRSTILADLKQVKRDLRSYQVTLNFKKEIGYYISGSEQNKRKVLVAYITQLINTHGWSHLLSDIQRGIESGGLLSPNVFSRLTFEQIYNILNEAEQVIGVRYADDVIRHLSLHIVSFTKRFTQGKYVSMDAVEKEVIEKTREFEAAKYICQKIESVSSVSIPEDEIFYMTTYLLGAKISEYEHEPPEDLDALNLKQIIRNMVDDFQTYACVLFEKRVDLEKNLFLHLKPAYYRTKYGIELENALTESVKSKYEDIYVLTEKVIHHFEYVLGKKISNDEIAYVAMHFGGWIEKEGVVVQTRKKAVVVCASGIGTSRLVQKQMEDLIPSLDVVDVMTRREYENSQLDNIDFIISTTPVEKKRDVPLFIVSPILSNAEKTTLLAQIQSTPEKAQTDQVDSLLAIMKKHGVITDEQALQQELKQYFITNQTALKEVRKKPMLHEILTKETIQFVDKVENWQEAIRLSAEPLLTNGSIRKDYVDAMILNIEKLGPYVVIAPKIALPHARPEEGVNSIGMSFLRIKEGCSFSEKPEHRVNLVFVLAAIDNETHLKALSQFSTMLSDSGNLEKLEQAETSSDVLTIIQKYSN
ncbi:BglG family transcription antiterminator [Metabacillus arenae]|uniref:BglG family transcription antiterminator n=1 Tax=Metabacillus arenae TaxID=2771434 RepID=A0A926NMY4_9BACI|nr:BglG family transcription antiterminator [Metabacillus arenae]MBD1382868.1 BglG family transcription antiterminator [Metabacillus arenae]